MSFLLYRASLQACLLDGKPASEQFYTIHESKMVWITCSKCELDSVNCVLVSVGGFRLFYRDQQFQKAWRKMRPTSQRQRCPERTLSVFGALGFGTPLGIFQENKPQWQSQCWANLERAHPHTICFSSLNFSSNDFPLQRENVSSPDTIILKSIVKRWNTEANGVKYLSFEPSSSKKQRGFYRL